MMLNESESLRNRRRDRHVRSIIPHGPDLGVYVDPADTFQLGKGEGK